MRGDHLARSTLTLEPRDGPAGRHLTVVGHENLPAAPSSWEVFVVSVHRATSRLATAPATCTWTWSTTARATPCAARASPPIPTLRELIAENCETDEQGVTRYRLVVGGPSVWVENPTGEDRWTIYGTAAGLPEPVAMPLSGVVHHDAICALDLLLDQLTA